MQTLSMQTSVFPNPGIDTLYPALSTTAKEWWTWIVGQYTHNVAPFEALAMASVADKRDTPRAWNLVLTMLGNPPPRQAFEAIVRDVLSKDTADTLVAALWPTQRMA
jgi:hypothetical protein